MWGTLLEIFSFFLEDMSLLACDLCFDIGNPTMDNLEDQIPNFYVFQNTSHVASVLLLLSEPFSLLPSLALKYHRNIS